MADFKKDSKQSKAHGHPLLADLFTGTVLAVIVLIASLSFGTLIFSGDLSSGVADGIGMALISAAIVGITVAIRSSYPGTIAIPQDRTAPILALMAADVAAAMPLGSPSSYKLINVLVALALTSIVTGTALYLLGYFRLGNLTRFIPYPVVGGFLSGSGWLLLIGSIRVMTGQRVSLASLPGLFNFSSLRLWLPGVLLGILLFITIRKLKKTKSLPLILVGSMVIFHLVMYFSGFSMEQARDAGWLPWIPHGGNFIPHIWKLDAWKMIEPIAIFHAVGLAATAIITSAISILLNSSALELAVHGEVDLNRELRAAGVANIAGGFAGGMLGFQSLSLTRLGHDLGSRTRVAGLATGVICALALFAGPSVFAYLPKFALGGLLFYLGLGFLVEWLYDSWAKFPPADYAVVVLIVAVMGMFGYLEGVGLGLLAAVFLFIHNYSRVGVITHSMTGSEFQSNVDRPSEHQRLLQREGGSLHLLKLQGFIFFGTANTLLNNIRARLQDKKLPRLKAVILDFRRVSGLDSSAALSLSRAGQLASTNNFTLLLTQVPESMQNQLQRGLVASKESEILRFFPDLDHALEWWESRILAEHGMALPDEEFDLRVQLNGHWPNSETFEVFFSKLKKKVLNESQYLIRQGDFADEIYFIESGEVSTLLEGVNGGPARRLRRQGGGTVLGELGLLLKLPRSASVVVNRPVSVYCLTETDLNQLKLDRPDVAADFYEFLSRYLSERVLNTTKSLRVLTD